MSELLKAVAEGLRTSSDPDFHVVGSDYLTEDSPRMAPPEPKMRTNDVDIVDPRGIGAVSVGSPRFGSLAYFLDGKEHRRCVMLHRSIAPVVYGFTGAVIRFRDSERRMHTESVVLRERLYFSHDLIKPETIGIHRDLTVNIAHKDDAEQMHPMILLNRAAKKVGNDRESLEGELASSWVAERSGGSECLMIDGPLTGGYRHARNIIGVIKSHPTQYFEMEEQQGSSGYTRLCHP